MTLRATFGRDIGGPRSFRIIATAPCPWGSRLTGEMNSSSDSTLTGEPSTAADTPSAAVPGASGMSAVPVVRAASRVPVAEASRVWFREQVAARSRRKNAAHAGERLVADTLFFADRVLFAERR